jgi:hypothetical protein
MKLSRRSSSQAPPSTGSVEKGDGRLSGLPRMHIDYDEAQSAEERGTYHSKIHLPFESLADVHPVARLKSGLRARKKRSGAA